MLLLRSEPGTIMLRVNGLSHNAPREHAVVLKLFRRRDCFFRFRVMEKLEPILSYQRAKV